MKTERLIETLARGAGAQADPRWRLRLALTLLAGLAAAAALVALGPGVREDIGTARMPVMMKAGFSALAAMALLPLIARLLRPGRRLRWRIAAAALLAALSLVVGAVSLLGHAPGERLAAWTGGGFPWCLVFIPLLGAPTAAGLVWLMRAFAPTRLALAGAAIGALAGGIGAIAYAMYCPVDSAAFVTTWYVLAIGLSAAMGALLGDRLLRW